MKLANPEDGITSACKEVERVLKVSADKEIGWAKFNHFDLACKQKTFNNLLGKPILACHTAWTKDVRESLFENRETLKFVGSSFGKAVKSTVVMNQCHFEDQIHHYRKNDESQNALTPGDDDDDDDERYGGFSVHTGACVLNDAGLSCKSFEGEDETRNMHNVQVGDCKVFTEANRDGDAVGEGKTDTVFDWVSLSSSAYGEAKRHIHLHDSKFVASLKDMIASPGVNKNTPVVKCKEVTSNYCDAGGRCNYPLSYLSSREDVSTLPDKVVAFDFALQKRGDGLNEEIEKCQEYWNDRLGWDVVGDIMQTNWGYVRVFVSFLLFCSCSQY